MIETARRYLAQKAGSVGVWIGLSALGLLAAVPLAAGQTTGFTTALAVFLLATGIVSRDASSGALQMILTRPIRRADYIVGRFLGFLTVLTGYLAATVVLAALAHSLLRAMGWDAGLQGFDWAEALRVVLQELAHGALLGVTILFFSTFLRGVGDLLAYLLAGLIIGILPQVGLALHKPALVRAGEFLTSNLAPRGPWAEVLHGGRLLQISTGQYFLALAGYLLLAVLIFNRREFSYGTD